MNEPAIEEWAMEKALAIDLRWNNDTEWYFSIARALMAADKAATERERERCFNLYKGLRETDRRGWASGDMITHNGAIADYAAAIRKGTE